MKWVFIFLLFLDRSFVYCYYYSYDMLASKGHPESLIEVEELKTKQSITKEWKEVFSLYLYLFHLLLVLVIHFFVFYSGQQILESVEHQIRLDEW